MMKDKRKNEECSSLLSMAMHEIWDALEDDAGKATVCIYMFKLQIFNNF